MIGFLERYQHLYIPEPNSGCFLWFGATFASGYGQVRIDGCNVAAHRLSCEEAYGPLGDLWALHRCDNKPCVNPDHLFPGTPKDNALDMIAKNRHGRIGARGELSGRTSLTEADVIAIRASKATQQVLAGEYGISQQAIGRIINRKRWSHI